MKGFTNPDGLVRLDFPGGWNGDSKNAFTGAGLSADELSVQTLVKNLAIFRKNSSALQTGQLMQYVPQNGLYVYFRYDATQTIMCVMNTGKDAMDIDFSKYPERTNGFIKAKSVTGKQVLNLADKPEIEPMQMWVMELLKQ
jgi:glycosidase